MHAVIVFVPSLSFVNVNVASPAASVTSSPLAGTGVGSPLTAKWTSAPGNGSPNWSRTVAVTLWSVPTSFESVAGTRSMLVASGGSVHVFVAVSLGSPSRSPTRRRRRCTP